ncbi:MAG: F0F1 ATP synthase subunit delta, partial [Clostridia bacterium]|nr:F0F1 ATP synthase subunit delta [Clostridia bacterium]
EKLEKMTGNTVLLDVEVNDSILGGMIVEIDGKVIDGSLQNRLNLVKDVIGR